MTLKRILAVVLAVSVLSAASRAQGIATGDVTIRSTPEGALVTLSGEAVVSGVSPVRFGHLLIGDYDLTVEKHGYERHVTKVILDPSKHIEIAVKLSAKTRYKAALRSVVIPGWGQHYGGQKTKGLAFMVLATGSVAAFLIVDHRFSDKRNDYNAVLRQYDSLTSIDELRRLYPLLVEAQRDAYDAENTRRVTIGMVAGVWGLNLLDALFLFPDNRTTFAVKGLTVNPSADFERVGITISTNF